MAAPRWMWTQDRVFAFASDESSQHANTRILSFYHGSGCIQVARGCMKPTLAMSLSLARIRSPKGQLIARYLLCESDKSHTGRFSNVTG